MNSLRAAIVVALIVLKSGTAEAATVSIDCDAGASLAKAIGGLKPGDTLEVSGTCKENVLISADVVGITLAGRGRATIEHPTGGEGVGPATHVIYVRGRLVTITGFTVRGGNDGIHLSGPAHAVIDGNVIIQNKGRGIHVDKGSIAQIVRNTIQDNGGVGINVTEHSYARIGFLIPPDAKPAPNTIRSNGGTAIHVERSSSAWIVGNAIRGNAGNGVTVDRNSQADVLANAIAGNRGDGIAATHNSGVNLVSEGTTRQDGPNLTDSTDMNAGVGIRCSVGGYVAGPVGTLTGGGGVKAIESGCLDRLAQK
jgi:parallel beta-helix repeat protein